MLQGVDFQDFSRDTEIAKQMISILSIFFAPFADVLCDLCGSKLVPQRTQRNSYRTLPILSIGQYPNTALP